MTSSSWTLPSAQQGLQNGCSELDLTKTSKNSPKNSSRIPETDELLINFAFRYIIILFFVFVSEHGSTSTSYF